jgi:endoglycosylceramidase
LPQGFAQADPTRSCEVFDDLVFQNAEDHATAVGDTLLLSEFGATDDLDTIERMVERADEFMLYCPCDDPTTSGPGATQAVVFDPEDPPEGDNLKNAKLDVLSAPIRRWWRGRPRASTSTSTPAPST